MNIEESNKLSQIAGAFIGMADDDECYERFKIFDRNNEDSLRGIIEEFIVPDYLSATKEQREEGLKVLEGLSAEPRTVQESYWDGDLPPFYYPDEINFYRLMYDILKAKANQ